MKNWLVVVLSALCIMSTTGCSLLNDVSESLDYASEATNYVNEAKTFAEDIPDLANKAVNSEDALTKLENKLQDMQKDIQAFNELNPSDVASDLHKQIVNQNEILSKEIETSLTKIQNGNFSPELLENTEMFQTLDEITDMMDQIQQLGG